MVREKFIKRAIVEATKSNFKQRHGCIIFKGGTILSTGFNEIRYCNRINHKYRKWLESGIHAEQKALLYSNYSFTRCSLLVVRLNFKNELVNSKPCPVCSKMIQDMGIKNVYYSDEFGKIAKESYA
jgi:deoxycytidylate deaminase